MDGEKSRIYKAGGFVTSGMSKCISLQNDIYSFTALRIDDLISSKVTKILLIANFANVIRVHKMETNKTRKQPLTLA